MTPKIPDFSELKFVDLGIFRYMGKFLRIDVDEPTGQYDP
jgi:hypothetical protein